MDEETFKCVICEKTFTYDSIGNKAKEGKICVDCSDKKLHDIIGRLDEFRKSKEFNNKNELIKKKLWLSEEMGGWHDLTIPLFDQGVEEVISEESVAEHMEKSTQTLQKEMLGELIDLMESIQIDSSDVRKQFGEI